MERILRKQASKQASKPDVHRVPRGLGHREDVAMKEASVTALTALACEGVTGARSAT